MIFFLICSQATFLIWQSVMGSKWSYGAKSRWKLSSVMRFTDGCRKTLLCVPVAFLQVRLISSELVSGAGKWLVEMYRYLMYREGIWLDLSDTGIYGELQCVASWCQLFCEEDSFYAPPQKVIMYIKYNVEL